MVCTVAWILYCLSTVGIAVFSVATVVVPPEVGGYVSNGVGDGVVSSRGSIGGQLSSSKQEPNSSDAIMQQSSLNMNSSSPTASQSRTQVPPMSFHGDSSHTHSDISGGGVADGSGGGSFSSSL